MADISAALPWRDNANDGDIPIAKSKDADSRVTVRLTGELGAAIANMQEITSASNPSEVVRRAIVVYHTLVQQKLKGNEPFIEVREGDVTKRIPIFL